MGCSIEDSNRHPDQLEYAFDLAAARMEAAVEAFEKAGADVLFAIGIPDLDAVRAICAAIRKPVNVMCGMPGRDFTVADLEVAIAIRDHGRLPA